MCSGGNTVKRSHGACPGSYLTVWPLFQVQTSLAWLLVTLNPPGRCPLLADFIFFFCN